MALRQSKRFNNFHFYETSSSEDPRLVPSLPPEIIFDILARLPVESLLRCKSVCKSWYSLISDPRFIKSHLSLSAVSNNQYAHHGLVFTAPIRNKLFHTCPLYDVLHDKIDNALDHDSPFNVSCDDKIDNYLQISGSCNGLVCVVNWNEVPVTLSIWNPATRRWIRLPYGVTRHCSHEVYSFGYDESTDDYKVVLIYAFKKREYRVKMYSLKTGIWRKMDLPHDFRLKGYDSGKFLNGALHWVAEEQPNSWRIVSLDLANEAYDEVLKPMYDKGNRDLALGVLGKCLCVLCDYESHADLWMMKAYGVKDSWTKLVSVLFPTKFWSSKVPKPLVISNDGKILFLLDSLLIVYDSKNNSFSKILDCDWYTFEADTFVESLVSLPVRWKLRQRQIP